MESSTATADQVDVINASLSQPVDGEQEFADRPESPVLHWRQEWVAPGLCLVAQALVNNRGLMGSVANRYMSLSGIWLFVHESEAALVGAPFAWEDADPILGQLQQFLFQRDLNLKYITASHLHLEHAAGLSSMLDFFDEAEFVYPQSWPRQWKSLSLDRLKLGLQPEMGRQFQRDGHTDFEVTLTLDLAGEPLHLVEAPYRSLTDQLMIFRGVALLPDWHLPNHTDEPMSSICASNAVACETFGRLGQFENDNNYHVHQSINVQGNEPLRHDFQHRLHVAQQIFCQGNEKDES